MATYTNHIQKHSKRNNFTIIGNEFLNSYGDILFAKDKAILCYFLSKPDNWNYNITDLLNKFKDGRDSIYSGIRNLVQHGFISRTQEIKKGAKYGKCIYHVFEDPRDNFIFDYRESEIQNKNLLERYQIDRSEKPLPENPDTVESQQNRGSSPLPENPDTGKPDTGKPDTEKPYISNTDSSNTYILYKEYPKFVAFKEAYPQPKRYMQLEMCFEIWLKQNLEYDENVDFYIEQTKAYSKIKKDTNPQYIKNPVNFLNEKLYQTDYLKELEKQQIGAKQNESNARPQNIQKPRQNGRNEQQTQFSGESAEERSLRILSQQFGLTN